MQYRRDCWTRATTTSPHSDLMGLVQTMYEDMVLSLMSNPSFVEVVWAPGRRAERRRRHARPRQSSTPAPGTRTANTYSYHARDPVDRLRHSRPAGPAVRRRRPPGLGRERRRRARHALLERRRRYSWACPRQDSSLRRCRTWRHIVRREPHPGSATALIRDEPDFSSSALSPSWKFRRGQIRLWTGGRRPAAGRGGRCFVFDERHSRLIYSLCPCACM